MASTDQPTLENHEETRTTAGQAARRGRGAASSSSRYGYRRFRNFQNSARGQPRGPRNVPSEETAMRDVNGRSETLATVPDSESSANAEEQENRQLPVQKPLKRRICRYFASEKSCYFGEHCRFLHVQQSDQDKTDRAEPTSASQTADPIPKSSRSVIRPTVILLNRSEIGKQPQRDARESEISYFRRRFRDAEFTFNDNCCFVEFQYSVTDPEWAFDMKAVKLKCKIPEEYPCAMLCVTLNDADLPIPLVTHFNGKVREFLEEKFHEFEKNDAYMCVCKTFIRWLDRHIFELFIEGLRKTKIVREAEDEGILLHNPEILARTTSAGIDSPREKKDSFCELPDEKVPFSLDEDVEGQNALDVETSSGILAETNPAKPDEQLSKKTLIEARIQWHNLSGNIATLTMMSIGLSIKCARCSALSFLTCESKQLSTSRCQKCANGQSMLFVPNLVHENCNIIALLEPKGCLPVDCVLLSSKCAYTCFKCNKEAIVENLIYGSVHKSWCHSCHSKCEFEITAIRFIGDFSSVAKEDNTAPKLSLKKKKTEQMVVLVEGQPLPDNGTCKHYKKSYRWFRFPCCGKLYPCDTCHDEAEKDHEMKLANRMVCGFCSKEQPFQKAKQCTSCKENVTRVKSQFWEGGKGCRNQALMSRNDTRKHTNSLMKTVSKKHAAHLAVKKNAAEKD